MAQGVKVTVSLQAIDKVSRTLTDINSNVKTLGKSTLGNLQNSFNTVALGVTALNQGFQLLSKTVTTAANFVKTFVDEAAKLEQIETRFQVLTGSADEARKVIKDLTEFTAKTPFRLEGVADSAAQLLSFGFQTEEIVDRLQVLGDIAAGSGSALQEIALIFGQVSAAGKLTGERLLQL